MKRIASVLCTLLLCAIALSAVRAQNVGIGTTTPNASALLDLTATSMGLLMPRVTTAQMNAISSPANGLVVFNSTANTFYFNAGTSVAPNWIPLLTSSQVWTLTGNASTSPGTNFLGTTDAQDLVFKTNGTERVRMLSTGNVGIGKSAPTQALDIAGNLQFSGALMPNASAGTSGYLLQSAGTGAAPTWLDPNASFWKLTGNSGSTPGTNFLGTTDAQSLVLKTNGTERMRITSTGNVGVGTASPSSSALVEFSSTSLGMLIPRMTSAQRSAITSPGTGLLVFQTDSSLTDPRQPAGFYFYTGSSWIPLLSLQSGWDLNGNTGTNPANNYIGTADNTALAVRTNNTERMRVLSTGEVGIGTSSPSSKLEVKDGNVSLTNSSSASSLRFYEPASSGSTYSSFAARTQAANLSYTLPDTAAHAGNLLANDGNGNLYWAANVTIGALNLGVSTTISLSGSVNDLSIPSNASVIRLVPGSNVTLTGISGGSDGRVLFLFNVASSNIQITLSNDNSNSTAGNRFLLASSSINLGKGNSAALIYDGIDSHWRIFATY